MKVKDLKGFGKIWGNRDESGRFEGFLERDL